MSWSQLLAALSGALAGTLAGFFGVGGNLVLVPLLSVLLVLGQQQAQGLTLAALLPPLGLPAVLHYRRAGIPLLTPVILVGLAGFVLGIPFGSLLANWLPGAVLRLIFAAFLATLARRQWKGLGGRHGGPCRRGADRPLTRASPSFRAVRPGLRASSGTHGAARTSFPSAGAWAPGASSA